MCYQVCSVVCVVRFLLYSVIEVLDTCFFSVAIVLVRLNFIKLIQKMLRQTEYVFFKNSS